MRQIQREVALVHRLNHDNIVKFHSWYITRRHVWVVSEFCAGGDLQSLLDQDKSLPESAIRVSVPFFHPYSVAPV